MDMEWDVNEPAKATSTPLSETQKAGTKRRRTETMKRLEFESALGEVNDFLEEASPVVEEVMAAEVLTQEQCRRLEKVSEKLAAHEKVMRELNKLGQELIREMRKGKFSLTSGSEHCSESGN